MAGNGRKDNNQSTGARPEWKARQQRKMMFGVLKAVVGVAILGVIVGLGIVFKAQIMAFFQKKEEPKVVKHAPPKPLPAVVIVPEKVAPPPQLPQPAPVPVTKIAPPKPAPVVVPTGEEEAAKKLLASGRAALEQFAFDTALDAFKQAEAKKCGAALRSEARAWQNKATQFELATRHIHVSDYAKAETSYVVKMLDDSEWVGLKLKEDDQTFQIQAISRGNPASEGRQKMQLPKMEIKEAVPVSLQDRQAQFLELLGALEQSVHVQNSTDYYDLVYLSKRLGLGKQCIEYLNRAYDGGPNRKPDPDVGNSMRKEVIRRALAKASLLLTSGRPRHYVDKELEDLLRKMPDYQVASDEVEAFKLFAAQHIKSDFKSTLTIKAKKTEVAAKPGKNSEKPAISAREMVTEEVVEVSVENSGVRGRNQQSEQIVSKANARYAEAMNLFGKFKLGTNGDNNKVLRDSLVEFEACIRLYEQALAQDPGNKEIENRMTEASMNCYSCRKYQTL